MNSPKTKNIYLAKAILFCTTFFLCTSSFAQNVVDDRRIEEQKRNSLISSQLAPKAEVDTPVKSPESAEYEYFEGLMAKQVASMYDACKSIVILLGQEQSLNSKATLEAFIMQNELLPLRVENEFSFDKPLRKGVAAYMFSKALGIKGGIVMRTFGVSQRYALKELEYKGILYPGNVRDTVSGKELIVTLSRAATYAAESVHEK